MWSKCIEMRHSTNIYHVQRVVHIWTRSHEIGPSGDIVGNEARWRIYASVSRIFIGSGNGLSPIKPLPEPLPIKTTEKIIKFQPNYNNFYSINTFENDWKYGPFCPGLNVLIACGVCNKTFLDEHQCKNHMRVHIEVHITVVVRVINRFFRELKRLSYINIAACSGREDVWQILNSSPPSAAYIRQRIGSALVQTMACRLFGAKPLSKPMLGCCHFNPEEQISVKF